MTNGKPSDAEMQALWREAGRRLHLADVEPPAPMTQIDALLEVLGPRRSGESLGDWLNRSRTPSPAEERPSAEIIHVDFGRRRFKPMAEIVRLAADTGSGLELPSRELETEDGRFRLRVTKEADQVVIAVQALGLASDQFAGRLIGIAEAGGTPPVALIELDEDGDGTVRLPDSDELRRAILRPVIGVVEDL